VKVVADTMIWVSYCVNPDGIRHRVIETARRRRVRLFVSDYTDGAVVAARSNGAKMSNAVRIVAAGHGRSRTTLSRNTETFRNRITTECSRSRWRLSPFGLWSQSTRLL
jgi:hypothetical protein